MHVFDTVQPDGSFSGTIQGVYDNNIHYVRGAVAHDPQHDPDFQNWWNNGSVGGSGVWIKFNEITSPNIVYVALVSYDGILQGSEFDHNSGFNSPILEFVLYQKA